MYHGHAFALGFSLRFPTLSSDGASKAVNGEEVPGRIVPLGKRVPGDLVDDGRHPRDPLRADTTAAGPLAVRNVFQGHAPRTG
jgi:hypothetical protein